MTVAGFFEFLSFFENAPGAAIFPKSNKSPNSDPRGSARKIRSTQTITRMCGRERGLFNDIELENVARVFFF